MFCLLSLAAFIIHNKMAYFIKRALTLLFCLAISFLTVHVYAQEGQVRISQGGNFTTADTSAIWQLIRSGDKLRFKAPDSSLRLYEVALNKSRSTNYTDGIARLLISIAALYIDRGDLSESLNILRLAKPYCEASTYDNGHYLIYLNKNLAAIYFQKNMFDTSAYYYYEALKQFEQKGSTDLSLLLSLYTNLGATWVSSGQSDLALKYLFKANDLAFKIHDDKNLPEIYNNLAVVYEGKELYDSAIMYGEEALGYSKKTGNTFMEAYASYEIGNQYLHKDQPVIAIRYYQNALSPDKNIPTYLEINTDIALAKAYHKLKKYELAEQYYYNVLNQDQAANYKEFLVETYNGLALLYADTKNYKAALKYKNLSSELKDSLLNAEKIQSTSLMEVKYRMSEKDKELAQNQLQLTALKQKNIWFYSLVIGLCLMCALAFTIYRGEKRKRKLQLILMADIMKEQEIVQLKAKLNGEEEERIRIARELHDGIMVQFSSVKMNLSCELDRSLDPVRKDAIEKIVTQLDSATSELRKSAHNLMPDMLLEEGLAEAVHYFLIGLKQSSGIEIDFQQYGDLPPIATEYELMLYRILQELSQNAIKHAHASQILVQLNYTGSMLSLTVEDNGIGFKEGSPQGEGIGIKNIRSRVSSLNGTMEISSNLGVGSTIYIEFDILNLLKNI